MNHLIDPRSAIVPKLVIALVVSAVPAVAACSGSATSSPSATPSPSANGSSSASPSPGASAAAAFDTCLVGTWTTVGQTQNSPANDEQITYSGGAGEVFTIDAQGGVTIDTHAAQKVVFVSAGETFSATVSGTGRGTVTTDSSGTKRVLYFKPSADDTRKTLSLDSTGTELGPARPDTEFSAVYTCAPGRFTFYKTAVNYMIDGPIVELIAGNRKASAMPSPAPS